MRERFLVRSRYASFRFLTFAALALAFMNVATRECHAQTRPPEVMREFRAAWVSTVSNIDWPSKPGLSTEQQQKELLAIMDKAVEINLNALILQIRPSADAIYPSKLEPWSQYLTGKQGQAPSPMYDPLEFAVKEAHARGLQLHVWFNPYRVRLPGVKGEPAPNHSSVTRKKIVRKYGEYLWFDPGEPEAEDHFIAVLMDVVKRYDIDGVHIDDYFYPYQVQDKEGKTVPFPDETSYRRAQKKGEKLERDDWRRQNVNHLIERMYKEVKKEKPWVLVGISPFGIWRPGHPPGITGLDQYSALYADAKLWFQEGWLDYFTPQLYWRIASEGQSYPKLLEWWIQQNTKKRHLWPGNFTSQVRRKGDETPARSVWEVDELLNQIKITRELGAGGNVHFSMKAIMQNYDGLADKLRDGLYAQPALVPESPWLGREAPAAPKVTAKKTAEGIALTMKAKGDAPWQWLVQIQTKDGWKPVIVPGAATQQVVAIESALEPRAVIVTGLSRLCKLGRPERVEVEGN